MKKKIIGILLITVSLALTGCGALVSLPEMSENEEELITEYAAGLMIKYDSKFAKGNLLDDDALDALDSQEKLAREKERAYKKAAEEYLEKKKAAQKEKESTSDNSNSSSDSGSNSTSEDSNSGVAMNQPVDNIASFFGIDGFAVNYTGYEICKSYSDSILMEVDADPGKQLLVLEFDVSNISTDIQKFDMFYRNPGFSVVVDGNKKVKNQGTLMYDDMASYNGEIGAGDTMPMVLLFEIDENISSIGNLVLNVKNGSEKGSIVLQ